MTTLHLLLLGLSCSSQRAATDPCRSETLTIYEIILRELIKNYDALPPQFDDPVGREYCLGENFLLGREGVAARIELRQRFSTNQHVHPLDWCEAGRGRLLSVGPMTCLGPNRAEVWSYSWMKSRPGGSDCLHALAFARDGWRVAAGCLKGRIYN